MSSREALWARRALALVALVAVWEWFMAARAYKTLAGPEDWQQVRAHLEASDASAGPVMLAESWMQPRARMELAAVRGWESVAPPDLHDQPRYRVLSLSGQLDGPELREDLLGLPAAGVIEAQHPLGSWTLFELRSPGASRRLGPANLLAAPETVTDDRGRCRRQGNGFKCKRGRVAQQTVEVGFRPRRCVGLQVQDQSTVTFSLPKVELGDRLRGHVGFGDFNARLRSDAAVVLEIRIDGRAPAGAAMFTDEQGWAAFELATPPGSHSLDVRVEVGAMGGWNDAGYDPRMRHLPCIELRALAPQGER